MLYYDIIIINIPLYFWILFIVMFYDILPMWRPFIIISVNGFAEIINCILLVAFHDETAFRISA